MPKLDNQKLDVHNIEEMLFNLTGVRYNFAISDSMRSGPNGKVLGREQLQYEEVYQLMPKYQKDMNDIFFNWYVEERGDYQDFLVKEDAVLTFICYWLKWKKLGQPQTY